MSVAAAIAAVAEGGMVVVVDDERRENEGDLILAGAAIDEEKVAFLLRHTSGVICAAMPGERLDELKLPLMVAENGESMGTAFTISVDAAAGVTTGISAADRARTLRTLADPEAGAGDLVRPGHVFPLRAREGGVLKRAGHTESAVDLTRLAGVPACGVLAELLSEDKSEMARGDELRAFAASHGMPIVSVADLVRARMRGERLVRHISQARVPTAHGEFECHVWRSLTDGTDHLAFVRGDPAAPGPQLVRVHSECLTGDVFGSQRCDCGGQLDDALRMIAAADRGVVIYLRGHEGRGIGIAHKIAAYNLQDQGRDTVDANLELGLPVDDREYGIGAQILVELGVREMRLMTNNPAKFSGLEGYGLEIVERVGMAPRLTPSNVEYLRTKRRRLGHDLPGIALEEG